ncbi:MAG: hypothetical protein IPM29_31735 [Planctomycetes bacterium]|nr:hypothetical protein [Planctomycetota bacterium]
MRRALYRPLGEGNAPTVDAISLRAGAIGDGWLPQTAGAMAFELQKAPSREGEQSGKQTRRLPYSRASFERVPHELGALYLRHQVNIEDAIVSSLEIPAEARAISVSLDRASVPMEEPIPRPPGRPRRNAPKITRVFHMAHCGTVTLHDGNGRALYSMRFGQMPASTPWTCATPWRTWSTGCARSSPSCDFSYSLMGLTRCGTCSSRASRKAS